MQGHRPTRRPSAGSWLNGLFDSGMPAKGKTGLPLKFETVDENVIFSRNSKTKAVVNNAASKQVFTSAQRRKQVITASKLFIYTFKIWNF